MIVLNILLHMHEPKINSMPLNYLNAFNNYQSVNSNILRSLSLNYGTSVSYHSYSEGECPMSSYIECAELSRLSTPCADCVSGHQRYVYTFELILRPPYCHCLTNEVSTIRSAMQKHWSVVTNV